MFETLDNLDPNELPKPVPRTAAQYFPNRVRGQHNEIIRLAHLGVKINEIGEKVGLTKETVKNLLGSEIAQDRLAEMAGSADEDAMAVSQRVGEMQHEALDVLHEIITKEGDGAHASITLRQKSAVEVLSMGGNGRINKIESKNIHGYLGQKGILDLVLQRSEEMRLEKQETQRLAQESGNLALPIKEEE